MTTTTQPGLLIDPRMNGPRRYANGGFASGTFADLVGGTATVALHQRVPVGRSFSVRESGAGKVVLRRRPAHRERLRCRPAS